MPEAQLIFRPEEKRILRRVRKEKGHVVKLENLDDEEINKFNTEIIKKWECFRPNSVDFKNIYGEGTAERDRQKVIRFKDSPEFKKEKPDAAVALEYVVMSGIYDYDWLGENAMVTPASEYDDFFNHIDFVVSFNDPDPESEEILYLGVDVTTLTLEEDLVEKKINPLKELLSAKCFPQVKYFKSMDYSDTKRGTVFMPEVIVGVEPKEVGRLAKLLIEKSGSGLEKDEIKYEITEEIKAQLAKFMNFLLKTFKTIPHRKVDDPEGMLSFFEEHEEEIKKEDERSWKMIRKYYKVLDRILKDTKSSLKNISPKKAQISPYRVLLSPPL